ncbi:fat-like cadherin-related tumor suppressor homolog [Tachypleus tridentatus]|uniref:fat-like cadherin-related tumor suppressor homolog n=1 Tax=Tachypleus tridentatus TaxID=6853 RepID=UPI003FD3E949
MMWREQRSRSISGGEVKIIWCLQTLWILSFVLGDDISFHFTRDVYNVTIPENPVGKVYVTPTEKMGIFVFDHLLQVEYHIETGNEKKFFVAEDQHVGNFWFLHIRTNTKVQVSLNRESKDSYTLQVKATISSNTLKNVNYSVKTEVHVQIVDTNDVTPLFYPSSYLVSVSEDTPLHQSIAKINAEDPDVGINGEIYYSFQNQTFQFAIHPTTGIIFLTRPLDVEKQSRYDLTVLAQDRGPKPDVGVIVRRNAASLKVVVNAVNQYSPDIDVIKLPVILKKNLLHVYAIVRVVDKDRGVNGQIRSLEIVDGDPLEYFHISNGQQPDEFTINISENLHEAIITSQFNLTLKATDKGIPPKFSVRTVCLKVPHYDDRSLIFDMTHYKTAVEEVAPVNTPVIFVKAKHPHSDENSEIFYKIEEGNKFQFFTINHKTGLIATKKKLDWEKKPYYLLTISAQDQSSDGPKRKGFATVHIEILDNNDNNPVFNSSSFITIDFEENKPTGSVVYTAHAYDLDDGDNGYVSYHLANLNFLPFMVDHFTGQIKTIEVLDFETMRKEYLLKVRASDWGLPFRRQSELLVRVLVTDVNDHRPQFEKVDCIGYVSKMASLHTEILTLSAIDFDAGSTVTYKMLSYHHNNCFHVHATTGILTLNCDLSVQEFTEKVVNVSATDGQHYADVMGITIEVVDPLQYPRLANKDAVVECRDDGITERLKEQISLAEENNQGSPDDVTEATPSRYGDNLHSPRFCNDLPKEINVKESIPINTELLVISAEDLDHGYNGELVYVISNGDEDNCFQVEMHSGKLILVSDLDHERTTRYALNISVSDLGQPPQTASLVIEVIVEDVNDNAPAFDKPFYDFTVLEDAPNGTILAKLRAFDVDSGSNGQLSFSLVSNSQDFYIDRYSGTLFVQGTLDRERIKRYELEAQVSDSSPEGSLYSRVGISVQIRDINDNPPRFPIGQYLAKLREDIPIGTVVMSLSANDPDSGNGGIVFYEIVNDELDMFNIDKDTGFVRLNRALDYEKQQIYNLTVEARDLGAPTLSSSAVLLVEVEDVNEKQHTLVFKEQVVMGTVRENQPEGTFVMQVRANDVHHRETEDNVQYFLKMEEGTGLFKIDQEGSIWTRASLDREEQFQYWLSVCAQTIEPVPLQTCVDVYIEVLDENDNVPLTEQPAYYPTLVEHSDPGTALAHLIAIDQDLNNLNELTFNITAGNSHGHFFIDPKTGVIRTTRQQIDREMQQEHVLEVTIMDSGSPPLSSTTRVVVKISDINDHDPEFLHRSLLRCTVPPTNTSATQSVLFRVVGMDRDEGPNGMLTYSLESEKANDVFFINPTTGEVTAKKQLRAGEEYVLKVRATDGGQQQRTALTRVVISVLPIPVISSNPPRVKHEEMHVKVSESEMVGHLVALIDVENVDGNKVWFSITGGNEENKFMIKPDERGVILADTLDWESCSYYNLTISITDGVHTIKTKVHVEVQDYNDNPPRYNQSTYRVSVSENVAVQTKVIQLTAFDLDQDKRLFYSLYNSAATFSRRMFHVDEATGVLSVEEKLDHELAHQHRLTVLVTDNGTPAKRDFARVIIDVEDHNDHTPEFLQPLFQGQVFETAAVGTSVVQVLAFDRDKGRNGQLLYSIVSGNVGNAFRIDRSVGTVLVAKELDHRTMSEYFLAIKVCDNGNPSLSKMAHARVVVTLANNAAPRFSKGENSKEIYENVEIGTVVTTVSAVSRSSVYYEIIYGNEERRFGVNPHSGVIFTVADLDYEKNNFYNLTIQATNLAGKKSCSTLTVHVLDYNDNRPTFVKLDYYGDVSEAAEIGALVFAQNATPLVVKAEDMDSDVNSNLHFEIVEILARDYFNIHFSTGAISVARQLDHEKMAEFHFQVQVFDTGNPILGAQTTARVHIHVIDTNDSPPQFEHSRYDATIFLPTYRDVMIFQVKARDMDSRMNSLLKYKIVSGNTANKFVINETSGHIFIESPRALQSSYSLIVSASDGVFEASTKVVIRVRKTERNVLRFDKERYVSEVLENSTEVKTVAVITVLGVDLNEHLTFSVLNPSEMFAIGPTSGVLRTTGRRLDREIQDTYILVVEVKGEATGELRVAHVLVEVTVVDVNDNAPFFVNLPYYTVALIGAKPSDMVWKVQAVDKDLGINKFITYELDKERSNTDIFAVDSRLGDVRLQRSIMADVKEYSLVIRAVDGGNPPLSSEATVHIKLVHEDMPTFPQQFYSVAVVESARCNAPVISIGAESPYGHQIIYSIVGGNEENLFDVDFQNGVIYVGDELDYEKTTEHHLTVRATDTKTGAYFQVPVNIIVEDVNDNPPSFTQDVYNVTISEATPFGTNILRVEAIDPDKNASQALRYSVLGRATAYFHVDSIKGNIIIKHSLDHEVQSIHHFVVMATDNGSPSLSTTADVWVTVKDLNDNAPQFGHSDYACEVIELARRGHFVTMVEASDLDATDQLKLLFSIVGGNELQSFQIHQKSGIVTVASPRQVVKQLFYRLNVSVTDGVYCSYATVSITVRSDNLYSPVFDRNMYDVTLREDVTPGTLVATVSATDLDWGIYGQVEFSIPSERSLRYFSVDQKTGQLYTKRSLDRESVRLFEIPVKVSDGGSRINYSLVRVTITDVNDNSPEFSAAQYDLVVPSNVTIGSSVLKVHAFDLDHTPDSILKYSIYGEQNAHFHTLFSITSDQGVLYVKSSLLGQENNVYQFFVKVEDKGTPPQEKEVPVTLRIGTPELVVPHFEQYHYTFFVSEAAEIGTIVSILNASSPWPLRYFFAPVKEGSTAQFFQSKFTLTEQGEISLASRLDREDIDTYHLTVAANVHGNPLLVSYTNIELVVFDQNDKSPVFDSNPYWVKIPENVEVGCSLLKVVARDEDLGQNSGVTYSLGLDEVKVSKVFSLDADTGWLTTIVPLDYETDSRYNFTVIAHDGGFPPLSCTVAVIVDVQDYNDNPVTFNRSFYEAAVYEDALAGTDIIVLEVNDRDSDEVKNSLEFYITKGNLKDSFRVQKTGELYIHTPLDREHIAHYDLEITVTDGKFISTTFVSLDVLDANDNPTVFLKSKYRVTLLEDTPVHSSVLQLGTTDADTKRNSHGLYFLTGKGAEDFLIDPSTAVLKSIRPLDREKLAKYSLQAHVQDNEDTQRESTCNIEIIMKDINDNPPCFTAQTYSVRVPEDAKVGILITRVHAVDRDQGPNRKVVYDFAYSAEKTFAIDRRTGIMSLNKKLDRERVSFYNLTVKATDHGFPQLSSLAVVHVQVQDINDNPPVFTQRRYQASVSEKVEIDKKVIQVLATSIDVGRNAEISYSIFTGNDLGYFTIHGSSGVITVTKQLDYEDIQNYFLTIEAKDGGTPSLTTHATVNISVLDANDNAPVFSQASYQTIIREDASVGYRVIQVKASDIDSAPNAQLSYSIIQGDRYGHFSVDREKGYIKIAAPLDREKIPNYMLEVECRDSGTPFLFSRVFVNVELSDVNDNPPVFSQTNYVTIIQENKRPGFPVVRFTVTDEDTAPNNGPFLFSIISGNEDDSFRIIPQDGVLETAKKFNYQYRSNYSLCIQVTDAGLPSLSSLAWITVHIVEESRFAPKIMPLGVTVTSYKGGFPGGILGRIRATDEDPYDTLSFDIVSPHKHLFQINHEDGTLSITSGLDPGDYPINISVTDDRFTTIKTINIKVIALTEDSIKHCVGIRLANVSPIFFVRYYKKSVISFFRSIFNVPRKSVQVISIQPAVTNNATRVSRETQTRQDTDILFLIRKESAGFYPPQLIRSKLKDKMKSFQINVGLEILKIMEDRCFPGTCEHGICDDKIIINESEIELVNTDTQSFVSHHFQRVLSCHCELGYGGLQCDKEINACARRPCPTNRICVPEASILGYACRCSERKTGLICDQEEVLCNSSSCYKEKNPISFGGRSFAQYNLNGPVDHHFSVFLHIRTVQETGNLMFAAGRKDYNILEIINGAVQYRVDFGSGEGIVRVEGVKLNDGVWHEVKVERRGSTATITVDDDVEETGAAPGVHDLLNLDGNDVYFGAEVRSLRYEDIRMGFVGCIDDIHINGVKLPLRITSTNIVATLRKFVNVEFQCGVLIDPGICGTQPCQNGGTCRKGDHSYTCQCLPRFMGSNCEVDTDPCASNPCLFGGTCSNSSNSYQCQCPAGHSGARCGYGHFCNPNPCHNMGVCEEGAYGPVCKCRGYHGDRCQFDLDECHTEPCGAGATCVNLHGTFQCKCQPNMTGHLCTEPLFTTSITSTSMNTTLEEIAGIVMLVVFLLVASVGLACCCKRYHRKCRRRQGNNNLQEDPITAELMVKNSMLHRDSHKNINKLSHLEDTSFTLPTVPPRPKVYTPTLQEPFNNLDTIPSYERVSKDLETFPRYATAFPRISRVFQTARNLPLAPPVASSDRSSVCSNTTAKGEIEEKVQNDDQGETEEQQGCEMETSYSELATNPHLCTTLASQSENISQGPDRKNQLVPTDDKPYDHSYEKLKCDNCAEKERNNSLQSCQNVGKSLESGCCTVAPSLACDNDDEKHLNRLSGSCSKEIPTDLSDDDVVSYGFPPQGGRGFMVGFAQSLGDSRLSETCNHANNVRKAGKYRSPTHPASGDVHQRFCGSDEEKLSVLAIV